MRSQSQYFGRAGPLENTNNPEGSITTKFVRREVAYSGPVQGFIFNLVKRLVPQSNEPTMEEAAAATIANVQNNGWDRFRLINSNLSLVVTCYTRSGFWDDRRGVFLSCSSTPACGEPVASTRGL